MTLALILQASIVLAIALAAAALFHRKAASVRHLIYVAGLAGALILPWAARLTGPVPERLSALEVPTITVSAVGPVAAAINWDMWIHWLWIAGIVVLALRFLLGAGRALWLSGTARVIQPGIRQHWAIRVPMVFGWLRPVILLPESAHQWPQDRREAVIRHERAHIQRRDCWWSLLIEAATMVFWFLPLVWIVAWKARQEAERASDDAVLRAGEEPGRYAQHLIEIARQANGWEAAAGIAMAEPSQLERRVVSVLDETAVRTPASRRLAAMVVTATAAVLYLVTGSVTGRAQSMPGGTIQVTVLDTSNARISNALVSIEDGSGGTQTALRTGTDGVASASSLPSGDYLLEVRAPGFRTFARGIRLISTEGRALDLILSPDSAETAVGTSRIRVGRSVQQAKIVHRVRPMYPQSAKQAGSQGTVFLQAVILQDGRVGTLEVLSAPGPDLAAAAVEAVNQWVYETTYLNGTPVEVVTKVAINFTLAP